jgi:spore maturation protein CgeB
MFVVPFTDQFIPEVLDEIKKQTTTLVYYFDDVWRIEYSKFWSKHFTFATTSDINGISKWTEKECNNFIYSPFGCNHRCFTEKNLSKIYPVSFVGSYHPYRAWVFKRLKKAGIEVKVFGHGWPNGRLSFEEMVVAFNQSKINLNLTNNESWDLRYILSPTKGFKNNLRVIRNTIRSINSQDAKTTEMVKARHFEINACGGFQLTYYTEGLERQYQIGNEIAIYQSIEDMIDKIRYYLKHEDERKLIAQQGYTRTIKDHTMDKRLTDLFDTIGLIEIEK